MYKVDKHIYSIKKILFSGCSQKAIKYCCFLATTAMVKPHNLGQREILWLLAEKGSVL